MDDYPTKERLAYDAELRRLFAKNNEAAEDDDLFNSSKFSRFQQPISNRSPRHSTSTNDSGNADAFSHSRLYENQRRLSDSFDFNPSFNSSIQEDNISVHSTPVSRPSPLPEGSSNNHDSLFNDSIYFCHDNPRKRSTTQNVCHKLFPESRRRTESFVDRVNSYQQPNTLFSDYSLTENVNYSRFLQNLNSLQPLISFAPPSHTSTQNVYFNSVGMPITIHYLPTAVNAPSGAVQNPVISSYSVPISASADVASARIVRQQNLTPRLIIPPKVTTSPVVFQVSPTSTSSSGSDDLIRKDKICSFCRKNGEAHRIYSTHIVKKKINGKYVTTCPILRSHVCAVCGASGDTAHTLSYCPLLKQAGIPIQPTTVSLKNTKMKSNGKPRQ